jgi:glucokinase
VPGCAGSTASSRAGRGAVAVGSRDRAGRHSGSDPAAEAALAHFARWLGRFAGDMALVYGARGGVYIGGGIPPHIVGSLKTEAFAASFRGKGALESYLAPVPVYVIKAAEAGLKGAAVAVAAANPLKGS